MSFRSKYLLLLFCMCNLGLYLSGCAPSAVPVSVGEKESPPAYPEDVQPLTPEECGKCHPRYYYLIKTEGGRHKMDCRKCHVQFHIYRPGKISYEDVLPKCSTCHDYVHGKDLAQCTECHSQVHSPLNIPAQRSLEFGCSTCHPKVDKEIKTFTTRHTELYCISCHHTKHGYIPVCMECHQPHSEDMVQADCLTCHNPHKALQVVYPENMPSETCAICHRNAFEMLRKSGTKHAAFNCTKCHPDKHRTIKRCQQCHDMPHGTFIMQKFRVCGRCHGVAHSLSQK